MLNGSTCCQDATRRMAQFCCEVWQQDKTTRWQEPAAQDKAAMWHTTAAHNKAARLCSRCREHAATTTNENLLPSAQETPLTPLGVTLSELSVLRLTGKTAKAPRFSRMLLHTVPNLDSPTCDEDQQESKTHHKWLACNHSKDLTDDVARQSTHSQACLTQVNSIPENTVVQCQVHRPKNLPRIRRGTHKDVPVIELPAAGNCCLL